jgi:hypothetical protein
MTENEAVEIVTKFFSKLIKAHNISGFDTPPEFKEAESVIGKDRVQEIYNKLYQELK